MKKFAKVIAVVLCFAMIACFAACGNKDTNNDTKPSKDGYTAKNTEFVIGGSGPLTGGAAIYGQAVKNGAQMAVDEINAAGGLNGVKFKYIATDDMHDATKVSTNYASLYEQGMQVSLGCVTTNPCLEWKNLSKEDNLFFLTPSASADAVPEYDNGYQMCFADGNQGLVAAKYVNENLKGETIGVFYKSDDAYSQGIFAQFKENLDESIKTVETVFTDANTSDFSSQIDTLKNFTFIFMPIYYQPASLFMTQAKDIMDAKTIYYGCDGLDGIETTEGFDINSVPQEISMLSHFNSKAESGAAKEFVDKYVEKYGKDTLNQFGASAYDCVYAIYNAMKAAVDAGKTIDVTISASDLCEILKEQFNGGFKFSGVTGDNISWESNGYVTKSAIKYIIKEAA